MNVCNWVEDWEGIWKSECGYSFSFVDGSPSENLFAFCQYCGNKLIESHFQEEDEDAYLA